MASVTRHRRLSLLVFGALLVLGPSAGSAQNAARPPAQPPAQAPRAGAHRARLSADLRQRLDADPSARILADRRTPVILTASPARAAAIAARHGLTVRKRFAAGALLEVPDDAALAALAADPDVDQLSGDTVVQSQGALTNTTVGADLVHLGFGYQSPAGRPVIGFGVGVAVIDSGIAPVPELRGRIVVSRNFIGDPQGRDVRHAPDEWGHGTHVAGIIAAIPTSWRDLDITGVAPGAHLANLKVLGADGSGFISDVIEALDWAVTNAPRYRLKVVNLSLGAPVVQSWRDDPLCLAIGRAHDAGLTVVTAAGNHGVTDDGLPVFGSITSPGNCPYAITVGALDDHGTPYRSDDTLAPYSSRGPTQYDFQIKPDLVAPGTHILGLVAPGASLPRDYPEKVIGSGSHARLELSGTSMATAVVSGAAALLIDRYGHTRQGMSPESVRFTLQTSAELRPDAGLYSEGAGRLNVAAALALPRHATAPPIMGEVIPAGGIAFASQILWGDQILWGEQILWGD